MYQCILVFFLICLMPHLLWICLSPLEVVTEYGAGVFEYDCIVSCGIEFVHRFLSMILSLLPCCLSISQQSDIMDVNDIFRDLSQMVHEQGTTVGEWWLTIHTSEVDFPVFRPDQRPLYYPVATNLCICWQTGGIHVLLVKADRLLRWIHLMAHTGTMDFTETEAIPGLPTLGHTVMWLHRF